MCLLLLVIVIVIVIVIVEVEAEAEVASAAVVVAVIVVVVVLVCLQHFNYLNFVSSVNIAPAVRVPEAVTPQQAASGQTAIMYPSAHAHALGQMVKILPLSIVILNIFTNKKRDRKCEKRKTSVPYSGDNYKNDCLSFIACNSVCSEGL